MEMSLKILLITRTQVTFQKFLGTYGFKESIDILRKKSTTLDRLLT